MKPIVLMNTIKVDNSVFSTELIVSIRKSKISECRTNCYEEKISSYRRICSQQRYQTLTFSEIVHLRFLPTEISLGARLNDGRVCHSSRNIGFYSQNNYHNHAHDHVQFQA